MVIVIVGYFIAGFFAARMQIYACSQDDFIRLERPVGIWTLLVFMMGYLGWITMLTCPVLDIRRRAHFIMLPFYLVKRIPKPPRPPQKVLRKLFLMP